MSFKIYLFRTMYIHGANVNILPWPSVPLKLSWTLKVCSHVALTRPPTFSSKMAFMATSYVVNNPSWVAFDIFYLSNLPSPLTQYYNFKDSFTRNVFCTVSKWVEWIPMAMFTHDVKKIKGAADRNGLKTVTCKQGLTVTLTGTMTVTLRVHTPL